MDWFLHTNNIWHYKSPKATLRISTERHISENYIFLELLTDRGWVNIYGTTYYGGPYVLPSEKLINEMKDYGNLLYA